MRVTVNARELKSALQIVKPATRPRGPLPIFACVSLEAIGGVATDCLRLSGTDLDVLVRVGVRANVYREGRALVSLAALADTLSGKIGAGDDVTLELEPIAPPAPAPAPAGAAPEGWRIVEPITGATVSAPAPAGAALPAPLCVSIGGARVALPTMDPEEYPAPALATPGAHWTRFDVSAGDLAQALAATAYAMSTDCTRPTLNGLCLELAPYESPARLELTATDGHRLAHAAIPRTACEPTGDGAPLLVDRAKRSRLEAILPPVAVSILERFAGARARAGEPAALELEGERARVRIGESRTFAPGGPRVTFGLELATRLVSGPFPNYRQVIPGDVPPVRVAVWQRAALAPRFKLLARMGGKSNAARGAPAGATLELEAGSLRLSSGTGGAGDCDAPALAETLPIAYAGPAIRAGFNARYLAEALEAMPADTIGAAFPENPPAGNGGSSPDYQTGPVILRPAGGASLPEALALVMPIRLGK